MRHVWLIFLLVASPLLAQEKASRTNTTELEFSIAAEWMQLTIPFGSTGNMPYSPTAPALGVRLRHHGWYIDFAGQLLERSVRQRRIAATMMRTFGQPGPFTVGAEIDYWELGFRRRVATVQETGVETYRQGRTAMAGPFVQYRGPWNLLLGGSVTAGWYRNEYNSVIVVEPLTLSEPMVRDETAVGKIQWGVQTGLIANRVRLSGSARYLRVFGGHSSWTPMDEWSGDARVDIRVLSRKGKSIFIGSYMRFGPSSPGLVSDKSFGIRGTAKLR